MYGNPAIAEVLFKARDVNSEFNGTEREMAEYYMARMFNTWDAIERAHERGMTSRATLEGALQDMRWTYDAYAALRYTFRDQVDTYTARTNTEVYRTAIELLENE